MASLRLINAVTDRVTANWRYTPIISPNTAGVVPDNGEAYLELLFPVTMEEQLSIGAPGNNVHEESGAFHVCVYVPIGFGINPPSTPWMTRVGSLMSEFRGVYFDGIECNGFIGPNLLDNSDDGAYYEITFAASYRLFIHG